MSVEAATTADIAPTEAPVGPTMEPTGIARSAIAAAPPSIVSAAGKVAARARRSMPAATGVTATTDVTPAAAASMTSASAAAAVLRQHRCRNDHRPQNSGCQKKAPTLGIHDYHLQLPAPPLQSHFKPLLIKLIRPTVYNAVQAVWCTEPTLNSAVWRFT
jgi:hypothetical protein